MNAFPKLDRFKALRLSRQRQLKAVMAKLPHLETPSLPEIPAMLKSMVERLGDFTDAAADLPLPARPRPAGAGGRFEERAYAGETGKRGYKLFIPSTYAGAPLPLLVMLHGCTQSPDEFATGTAMNRLAEEAGFLVAYPAQARTANISKCWNWFNPENQQRGGGEAALIAGITRQVMADFAVRPGRVYVAGMSAGGAMAAIMGAAYPELYAAIGVHSGLGRGAARDMSSAMAAMSRGASAPLAPDAQPVPAIVFHGDHDHTVSPDNAAQVIEQARAGAPLSRQVTQGEAGGVAYTRTIETIASGRPMLELWVMHGAGHAWSGGNPAGSYADAKGPDASREMLRFFLAQPG